LFPLRGSYGLIFRHFSFSLEKINKIGYNYSINMRPAPSGTRGRRPEEREKVEKKNIAVIGQGRSGKNIHGKYYRSDSNRYFNVRYAVDFDPVRRRISEEIYPGCTALSDYTELFGRDDIDLVVNAVVAPFNNVLIYFLCDSRAALKRDDAKFADGDRWKKLVLCHLKCLQYLFDA